MEQNAHAKVAEGKITPPSLEPTSGLKPIAITENYRIFQQTNSSFAKDSHH